MYYVQSVRNMLQNIDMVTTAANYRHLENISLWSQNGIHENENFLKFKFHHKKLLLLIF